MARPALTFTDGQKAEVETLAAVLTSAQIADYFGIGRRTFYDLMARDPEIAALYKKGKARAVGAVAQGLIQQARSGNTTAMIFFLKTQGGWRERTEVEHHLPDREETARALDLSQLSPSALKEIVGAADAVAGDAGAGIAAPALPGPASQEETP